MLCKLQVIQSLELEFIQNKKECIENLFYTHFKCIFNLEVNLLINNILFNFHLFLYVSSMWISKDLNLVAYVLLNRTHSTLNSSFVTQELHTLFNLFACIR